MWTFYMKKLYYTLTHTKKKKYKLCNPLTNLVALYSHILVCTRMTYLKKSHAIQMERLNLATGENGTKWQCVNKNIISMSYFYEILVHPLSPGSLVSMTSCKCSAYFFSFFLLIVLHLFQLRPWQHVQCVCWQEAADRRDGQSSGGDVCQ